MQDLQPPNAPLIHGRVLGVGSEAVPTPPPALSADRVRLKRRISEPCVLAATLVPTPDCLTRPGVPPLAIADSARQVRDDALVAACPAGPDELVIMLRSLSLDSWGG